MSELQIKIIHEPDSQKPFVIIDKPAGLPSAPLNENDTNNAFYQAAKLFPDMLEVQGKKSVEHGLLHRLDTATAGLMIIAATQKCYDFLQNEQKENRIIKTYLAECNLQVFEENLVSSRSERLPEPVEGQTITITSYFRAYGPGRKEVRPVFQEDSEIALKKVGKKVLYTTNITIKKINEEKNTAQVECTITNGYRHQVRCHLAWCGLPVIGDIIYNPQAKEDALKNKSTEQMHFCASKIQFEYPEGDLNSYDRKDTWT